ncbi:MAG: DUF4864 domain-containing protein [Gammaproteobacteria bacterium]
MTDTQAISPKSGLTAFILCLFLGALGVHRFYVGKIGTGILMILTLGGIGFWTLYDLFSIVCKNFTDKQGRVVEIAKSPNAPRNVVIVVACIYVLFLGAVFTLVGVSTANLARVGKNELLALRQNNIEQAYSYTSSAFQNGVSIDTFKKFLNSYPQLINNDSSSFTNVEFKNNNGTITGTLNMKDGSTVPFTMLLVKENDQWKINEINVSKTKSEESNQETNQAVTQKPADTDTSTDTTKDNTESTNDNATENQ